MVDHEKTYTTYEIEYKLKYGKKMRREYVGDDKATYEQVLRALHRYVQPWQSPD